MSTARTVRRDDRVIPGPALALYLQAVRVKSLWISSICVLSGGAVAIWQGHANLPGLILAWLAAVAAQGGTNLTNVYYNYKSAGAPTPGALLDPQGSAAPVRTGQLAPELVRNASFFCFAVAIVAGVALTTLFGWRILAMGVPGLLAGFFYAAPPVRLAYLGLGVFTVFLFMGPVMVMGTYWVQAGYVSPGAALASVPIGLLAAGIMHINDVRDVAGDLAAGKRTVTTTIGRDRASWLLVGMSATAYAAIVGGVVTGALPATTLITLLTMPRAVAQARLVLRERDAMILNRAWFMGVQLHTQFGVLFIAALLLASVLGRPR